MAKKKTLPPATCNVALIDLDRIDPSAMNPRRNFAALDELAASLKAQGMLHPVVCRQKANRYELLAGRRRYEAAKLAGMQSIPASIVECDDDAAMDICVTENLQREQLNPIEEARGVRMLLDGGRSVADIADKLGKSVAWVYRRDAIARLVPEFASEVERGTRPEGSEHVAPYEVSGWWCAPVAVLEYVGRLPEDVQARIQYTMADDMDALKDSVEDLLMEIAEAPWNTDGTNAFEAKCAKCAKRTDAQAVLFEDMAESGRCLDRDCWDKQIAKFRDSLRTRAARDAGINVEQVHVVERRDQLYWQDTMEADPFERGAKPMVVCDTIEWRKERRDTPQSERAPVPRENRVWQQLGKIAGGIAGTDDGEVLTQDEVLCYVAAATTGYKPTDARFWKTYDAHMAAQGGRKPTAKNALWATARLRLPSAMSIWDASRISQDEKDGIDRVIAFLHLDRETLWSEAEEDATKKESK